MPATLHAHNTLFGQAPRTIWKGGSEIEAEYEWEIFKRFYEEDKPAAKRAISSAPVVKPIRVTAPNSVFALGGIASK